VVGFLFILLLISLGIRKNFIRNMNHGVNQTTSEIEIDEIDNEDIQVEENEEDLNLEENEEDEEEPSSSDRISQLKLIDLNKWTEEWNDWISSKINSYDASSVMNLNRYQTSKELVKDKKNKALRFTSEQMKSLIDLEKLALKAYRAKTRRTRLKYFSFEDEEYTGLITTIIMTQDYQYALEIKVDESNYWQANSGFIPQTIMCELQHQMMLTGLKQIDYWCFLKGYDGILIKVDRNDSFINDLLESENKIYSKIHN
jgi:predicted phage-related endonuclease